MKKNLCLLLLLLLSIQLPAQFTLSGAIRGYSGKTPVSVNTPVVYGFHQENTVDIPVNASGQFNIILPVTGQQFVSLIYQRKFYTLLLTAGKELVIALDEKNKTLRLLSGDALQENLLLQQIDMDSPPFFWENGTFDRLSLEELQKKLIDPFFSIQNEHFKTISAADISERDKKLIASEVKYLGYNYLSDFGRTRIDDRDILNNFVFAIFDPCVIDPEFVPAGPQYYAFADNYLRYLETKAFVKIKKENITPDKPIPYYGISLDSANVLVKKYGKPYWRFVGSLNNFPPDVAEKYNFQQVQDQYYARDLAQVKGLAEAFKKQFPQSPYNKDISRMMNELGEKLAANQHNRNIVVVKDYDKVQSIYEVVKTLKGKVVYLDIWGTWCGPCKEEIKQLPGLKAAFADKDVAYIYLAMDDDDRDALWKDYIKVNNMEGVHLRKTRQTIAPFWKELLADHPDKAEYYPQYFLFDKTGKLVVSKAKRPSEKEALYEQINALLKGN
ncbi:TlpA family protein disulfide reductase [Chitinophaga barathri]|uniref:TlpA family protein disulfide reductase n=1 Tax=Chitinophaga barathri TaxID=1647451 RepID=A0A3N4MCN5_9BACT|nr:TlpA disulfide reductase family protein [Chitinophaga barathri]RPD41471.1 TlpA family protein disulfide reductase [Chitinophaga barathri]